MIRKKIKNPKEIINFELIKKFQWQIFTILGLVIVSVIFFPSGKSLQYNYQKDDIARETIIASETFPILKPDAKLQEDLDEALKSEPALFNRNQDVVNSQIETIDALFNDIEFIRDAQTKLLVLPWQV